MSVNEVLDVGALKKRLVGDDIFTVDALLSADECATFDTASEGLGYDSASVNTW